MPSKIIIALKRTDEETISLLPHQKQKLVKILYDHMHSEKYEYDLTVETVFDKLGGYNACL